jgi:hypothetical protein
MSFLECAPKDLCDYYKQLVELKPEGEEERSRLAQSKELLERLLTNETMIPVWKAFAQIANADCTEHHCASCPRCSGFVWYRTLHTIMDCYAKSGEMLPTRADIIEKLKRIAKSANELSRAFRNTPFDTTPFKWLNESNQEEILEVIKIEQGSPKCTLLCNECRPMSLGIENDIQGIGLTLERSFPLSSTMSSIMKNIADEAKEELKMLQGETEGKMRPLVSNWGSQNARANYFIRGMAPFFRDWFGGPRYALLAKLASAALGDDKIKEPLVRSSIRDWQRRKQASGEPTAS